MARPNNQELYNKIKSKANTVFDSPTGLYRSAWIIKEYKKAGGTFDKPKPAHTKIGQWLRDNWVDLNQPKAGGGYEKCGHKNIQNNKYPLCRPMYKVNESSPKTLNELSKSSIDRANKEKQVLKNKGNVRFND